MLELPEIATLARQINAVLPGKRICAAVIAHTPHKFAWLNHPPEKYRELLTGRQVGQARGEANFLTLPLEPDWALVLGEMGGRVLFHPTPATIPSKHQLLLQFADDTALSITIQMWGGIFLVPQNDLSSLPAFIRWGKTAPTSPDFTFEFFQSLLEDPEERVKKSVKYFMISKPGVAGVGNGCLQDILYHARLHPKHLIPSLTPAEQRALYDATRATLQSMVAAGGRDVERDLHNQPGGYICILGSHAAGKPCPQCCTPIEKIAYLGGATYFCPQCQQ